MAEPITWAVHANVRPANTDEAALLLAGAGDEYNGVLRICNQDTQSRTYRVAHCMATGAAAGKDWLAYDVDILNGEPPHEYSIHLGNSQEIRIKASVADKISFHFSGEKKVTS